MGRVRTMAGRTVLIVDDSSIIRTIIQRELAHAGYEALVAANGMEALAMIEWMSELPDIITLDIDMPVMGGFEVCERLRAERDSASERKRRAAQIPIIFVSANDSLEHRERGYQLEVIDFISKPFGPGDIIRAVDRVLSPKEQFPGMRALVVDDSQSVRRIVRSNLIRSGLAVIEAGSGEEALALVEREEAAFDIVIIDQMMPGMSGEELCRRLSGIDGMEQVPKFFVSSMHDKESILSFFKAGASDYLKKPFIAEELHARVETHLRLRQYVQQLKILNRQLEEQASRDALTGLLNRRSFQEAGERTFAQALRSGNDLGCMMLDLDYFKKINDCHGHACGDMVLRGFAGLVAARLRKSDIVARYGGEEFIVLLADTGIEGAAHLAGAIRELAERECYGEAEKDLRATCSIGVTTRLSGRAGSLDELIRQADEALYRAKGQGRNRFEVYGRDEKVTYVKMGQAVKGRLHGVD